MPLDFTSWKKTAISGFFFAAGAAVGWKAVVLALGWLVAGGQALIGSK